MNKNILIVLGGAVLAAVLVAVLVQVTLGGKKPVSVSDADAVKILVAAKDLKKGHELDEGDLTWQERSEDTLFKGAIIRKGDKKAHEALNGRLERGFSKGEALVKRAIIKVDGNYVVARLRSGERAVSVKLSVEDMVAGFITPGSYVDIILTYKEQVSIDDGNRDDADPAVQSLIALNLGKMATETILQNIRVLAVDQKAELKKDAKIKVGKTITLAVSIRDAERLTLASEMGRVTLAMRGIGDDVANIKEPVLSDARLTTIADEIYADYIKLKTGGSEGPMVSTSNKASVKVYNGAQVQELELR